MKMEMNKLQIVNGTDELLKRLQKDIQQALDAHTETVFIGLSGGSVIGIVLQVLKSLSQKQISRLRFYFCDERLVPTDNKESTFGEYWREIVKSGLPITKEQFAKVNEALNPADAANEYAQHIKNHVRHNSSGPEFDILLLGIGPDGHTCSIFPGHSLMSEQAKLVGYIENSPKPPPKRITFTYPLINNARQAIFIAMGSSKKEVLKEIFNEKSIYPAALVQSQQVVWYVDKQAAELLHV